MALLAAATVATPALAQSSNEDLVKELRRRDQVIDQLLRRVDALERQTRQAARSPDVKSAEVRPAPVVIPRSGTEAPPASSVAPRDATPRIAAPQPGTLQPGTGRAALQADTSEDAMIARALENTLINQGGQLLQPYEMQLVPDFNFSYQSLDQLSFFGTSGNLFRQRSHIYQTEAGLGFRIGLPWETQFSVRIPFGWTQGSATFGGTTNQNSTRTGFGDVSFGIQKQILHESGAVPDLLMNLSYKTSTGSTSLTERQFSTFPFQVGTGSGFDTVGVGATVLKRQDPLVFLGAVNYFHPFEAKINGFNQSIGDIYELRMAAILAASPDTALRIAWDTSFQGNSTFNGQNLPGSNQVVSFVEFGVGSVLSRNYFLDAAVQIGLTRDSPDMRFLLAIPIRF